MPVVDIVKKEISEKIKLLHSLYGIIYKKTGHINKNVELSLLIEVLDGFTLIDKEVGLSNFPKVRSLIVTMSKISYGKYNITDKIIEISKFTSKEEIKKTLYHEYGHHMYYFIKRKSNHNNRLKVLLSDMNEMETLSGINYVGEIRKKDFESQNGQTRSRATKYLNNYEKYLLEATEVFARLMECHCSNYIKKDLEDDWHFSKSEMSTFQVYINDLRKEMGVLI